MDRALSEAAMLAALPDPGLPGLGWRGLVADLSVALGAGLLLAVAVSWMLARLSHAPDAAPEDVARDAGRIELLQRLKTEAPERYAGLRADLYRRDGLPEAETLRKMLGP